MGLGSATGAGALLRAAHAAPLQLARAPRSLPRVRHPLPERLHCLRRHASPLQCTACPERALLPTHKPPRAAPQDRPLLGLDNHRLHPSWSSQMPSLLTAVSEISTSPPRSARADIWEEACVGHLGHVAAGLALVRQVVHAVYAGVVARVLQHLCLELWVIWDGVALPQGTCRQRQYLLVLHLAGSMGESHPRMSRCGSSQTLHSETQIAFENGWACRV